MDLNGDFSCYLLTFVIHCWRLFSFFIHLNFCCKFHFLFFVIQIHCWRTFSFGDIPTKQSTSISLERRPFSWFLWFCVAYEFDIITHSSVLPSKYLQFRLITFCYLNICFAISKRYIIKLLLVFLKWKVRNVFFSLTMYLENDGIAFRIWTKSL